MSNALMGALFGLLLTTALFIDSFISMFLSYQYRLSIGLAAVCLQVRLSIFS
jgi:hypothetical protein